MTRDFQQYGKKNDVIKKCMINVDVIIQRAYSEPIITRRN